MQESQVMGDYSKIKIGIIGSEVPVRQIKDVLKSFPNFEPSFHVVEEMANVQSVAEELMKEVEVLLFTEFHFYQAIRDVSDFRIPVHHIPLTGTGLYRSLFILKSNYSCRSLSIDSISEKYVEQTLAELGENYQLHVYPSVQNLNREALIQFHVDNFNRHQTIALTGIYQVAEGLKALEVPVEWVIPSQQDMSVSLERALLATNTRKNKESQIVFGLINIDNFKAIANNYNSEHNLQLLKLKVQEILLDYIKQLDGHLSYLGGDEYSFITTRGIFERETRGYKYIPLLEDIKNEHAITLSIGIGFGRTAAESGNHARLALGQSKEQGGDLCYIVREDRSVLGPVDITSDKQYETFDLSIVDPDLLERAEKAGMSASYMTALMSRVARHRKIDYTAQELADTLKITVRSAHRILLKWMDAELVSVIGEERVTKKGRPRRIYRLNFVNEEGLE